MAEYMTLHSKYNVLVGDEADRLAIKDNIYSAHNALSAFIGFVDSVSKLAIDGDSLLIVGRLKCHCGKEAAFKKEFSGASRESDHLTICNCGTFGFDFHFHTANSGYENGFFMYFRSHRNASFSMFIDDVILLDDKKRQEPEYIGYEVARKRKEEQLAEQRRQMEQQQRENLLGEQRIGHGLDVLLQRSANGQCRVCGKPLGIVLKLLRRYTHPSCTFSQNRVR